MQIRAKKRRAKFGDEFFASIIRRSEKRGAEFARTTFVANGNVSCEALPVSPDWQTIECTLPSEAWRAGVNGLELRFGYAQRPADVGLGGDTRPLAAAVDWIRVSVVAASR